MTMLSPDFAQNPRSHDDPAALITDAITEVLRAHARRLIAAALETEVASVVAELKAEGASAVRNGYLPERSVTTAIGDVKVKVPRIRSKDGAGVDFTSTLVPRYLWRSKSISAWAAYAYLKGVSEADMAGELEVVIREGGQKAHPRGGLLAQERVGGELRRLGQAGSLFDAAHLHLCRRRVPADTGGQSQAVRTGDPRSRRQRQEAPRGAGRRRARVCPGLERSAPGSALSEDEGPRAGGRRRGAWLLDLRSRRSMAPPPTRGAGSTRAATSSTTGPNRYSPRRAETCPRSGWPPRGPRREKRSRSFGRSTRRRLSTFER